MRGGHPDAAPCVPGSGVAPLSPPAARRAHPHSAAGDTPDPGNGLFDPNNNHRIAGFIFNEFKFSDWTKGQIAGRVESVDLSGTARIFPGDGALLQTPVARNYTPKSASVGLIQNLPWDLVGSVTAQYVER